MAKRTTSKKSGTARMLELGYTPMQIWLSPIMRKWLRRAAADEHVPQATFALNALHACLAARHFMSDPTK